MKPDALFDFTVDREQATIMVKREFAGRRQLVWDCHTRSDLLDRWFAPKPLTAQTRHMDFREGGHWHFAMVTPDGQSYWSRLDYVRITPIDGYDALDSFSDETGAVNTAMPQARWGVSFTESGPKQTIVSTAIRYASQADVEKVIAMGLKDGLTSTMQRLDELLASLADA
ncbi:MAG: SRPBCC domain-containing protein [Rubrivivax sp.]|nr:MAG: SRPBCC domain-containing protein [Rubrivivax sp.]